MAKIQVKPQLAAKVELMKLAFEILKTQAEDGKVTSEGVVLVYKKLYGELGSLVDIDDNNLLVQS